MDFAYLILGGGGNTVNASHLDAILTTVYPYRHVQRKIKFDTIQRTSAQPLPKPPFLLKKICSFDPSVAFLFGKAHFCAKKGSIFSFKYSRLSAYIQIQLYIIKYNQDCIEDEGVRGKLPGLMQLGVWGHCKPPDGVQGQSPGSYRVFEHQAVFEEVLEDNTSKF